MRSILFAGIIVPALVSAASKEAVADRLATGFLAREGAGQYWAMSSSYRASFDASGVQLVRHGRRVAIRFPGARLRWQAEGEAAAQVTFLGAESSSVGGAAALRAPEAYPGVDIVIRLRNGRLKSEFQLAAGVSPAAAGYCMDGADIHANEDGQSLHLDAGEGWEWDETGLESWQTAADGAKRPVRSQFMVRGSCVRFQLSGVNPVLPLTIDPELAFSSYLGGGMFDAVTAVAIDAAGNTFLGGWTESSDFPTLSGLQSSSGGRIDGFVAKVNSSGQLVYATYLGGIGEDRVQAIVVDGSGFVTVAGHTSSSNFPVLSAARGTLGGGRDAFVSRLVAAGNQLVFSTFLGGSGQDAALAVAVDLSGNIVAGGETASSDFPVQAAYQSTTGGGVDGFLTRFSSGGLLLSSSYFGGGSDDRIRGIAVGSNGTIHATGSTASSNLPVAAAPYPTIRGSMDAFYTRFNSVATGISLSTYVGGAGGSSLAEEAGYGITVDALGRTWIAGVTPSTDFPGASSGNQPVYGGGPSDAFVTVFTAAGALEWSTYIGGAGLDGATGISAGSGFVGLAGYTTSINFPVTAALQATRAGEYDAFWAAYPLASTVPLYISYIGGSGSDSALAAAASGSTLVIGGSTLSSNFPVQSPIQSSNPGSFGGFVSGLRFGPGPLTVTPAVGNGLLGTFAFRLAHANGQASIVNAAFLFNAGYSFAGGCYVYYDRGANLISLYKDVGATWLTITPGAAASVNNGVCAINGSGLAVTATGNVLTITLPITFAPAFGGNKLIFANANDAAGLGAGWPQLGTWSITSPSAPAVGTISPASGTGLSQTFTVVYSDGNGAADISIGGVLFNNVFSTANGCYFEWRRSTNTIVLFRDSDSTFLPVTPGITATVENANCSINGSGASVSDAGTQVTLTVPVTFKSGFVGTRTIYASATDRGGLSTGWQNVGSWVPAGVFTPTVASVSPSSGAGGSQAFTAVFLDNNGFSDFATAEFLINTSPVSAGACHVRYDRPSNTAFLFRDSDSSWLPLGPGSALSVANLNCSLAGSGFSVVGSGNSLTITLLINFSLQFSGPKSIYLRATDGTGLASGWVGSGSWTVNQTSAPTLTSMSPTSGAGPQQNFNFVFSDANGYTDVASALFIINSTLSGAAACFIGFDRAQNVFQLFRDADNSWLKIAPGSNTSVTNEYCTLSGADLSLTGSGLTISVALPLSFKPAFSGTRNFYVNVTDAGGLSSGWLTAGTWMPAVPMPPVLAALSPSAANSPSQTFTATARDGNGYADIYRLYFLLNTDPSIPANSCHGFYDRAANGIYLYNDALTVLLGPITPGVAGTLQNSQCAINGAASSVTASGTDLVLNLGASRQGSYASGTKTLYFWVKDNANNDTGWIAGSTWQLASLVPVAPALVGVSPSTTAAVSQTFTASARDGNGYADIYRLYFLLNSSPSVPANSCHGFYDRASNGIFLYNDALTVLLGPITPGVPGTLQNTQCVINGAASGVTASGADLVLNLNASRQGSYASGTMTLYFWVKDNANNDTGWISGSSWALPSLSPVAPTLAVVSPSTTSATSQTFTATARDGNGYADIYRLYFLLNTDPSIPADSCHGFYDRAANGIYLYNDALTVLLGPITPGASGTLQNSQCAINGAASSVTASGTDLVLNLSASRQGSYASGSKTLYFWVKDNANNDTGWIAGSTWQLASPVPVAPALVGVSPSTTAAISQTFAVTARDGNGYADIYRLYFLLNSNPAVPANSCHGFYDRASNGIFLYNDALTVPLGPITPGVSGTLQNTQCAINGAASAVTASGADLVLNLGVSRQGSYASGTMTLYFWVKDNGNNDTGWISGSSWALPSLSPVAPTLAGVSPSTTSATSQTLTATARDGNGYADIYRVYFLLNTAPSIPANSCHGFYDRAANGIYLYNDALTVLLGPITPGASGTLQNSQCAINGAASSVTASGTDLVLNLSASRQGSYASGTKTLYFWVKDNANTDTGWIAGSNWVLPGQ